jgi:hypothetical protein
MNPSLCLAFALLLVLPGAASAARPLLLYGGEHQETFLGCLNLSDRDEESLWNPDGVHGPGSFKEKSIWNSFSEFGGSMGDYSPFNRWSKHPPAIYDSEGRFLGFMTVIKDFPQRTRLRLPLLLTAYGDAISRDVPAFYDLYFRAEDGFDLARRRGHDKPARRR